MSLHAGHVLGGKYRLSQPLGEGGMGCVWLAEDTQLGREVAVKLLSTSASEPVAHKRFTREARLAAQLASPHVAQVFDFGVHERQPFIVMERLQGEDLDQRLSRGRLDVETVRQVVDGVAAALSEAHGVGIVHRDIKPANLFFARIGRREIVKVLDFGIATKKSGSGALTAEGTIIGTPLYMSPEQSQGLAVDHRSDLWSLAVVAYEALTGSQPFTGSTDWESLAAIAKRPIPPPTRVVADLPGALDDFFHVALRRAPERRFASADRLAAAFDAACRGEAIATSELETAETAPVPLPPGVERPSIDTDIVAVNGRRDTGSKRIAPLAGIAMLAVVAAGGLWMTQREGDMPLRAGAGLVSRARISIPAPSASEATVALPSTSASASADVPKRVVAPTIRPPSVAPRPTPEPAPEPTVAPAPVPRPPPGNEFGI